MGSWVDSIKETFLSFALPLTLSSLAVIHSYLRVQIYWQNPKQVQLEPSIHSVLLYLSTVQTTLISFLTNMTGVVVQKVSNAQTNVTIFFIPSTSTMLLAIAMKVRKGIPEEIGTRGSTLFLLPTNTGWILTCSILNFCNCPCEGTDKFVLNIIMISQIMPIIFWCIKSDYLTYSYYSINWKNL